MKGANIGELEELVLLVVGILHKSAYGVAVMDEIGKQTGRNMNISAVHTVLTRLEEKGLLQSEKGDATNKRGGRRKRLFTLTAAGRSALANANELRNQLFKLVVPLTAR